VKIRFYIDPETGDPHIYNHAGGLSPSEKKKMKQSNFPPGWNDERVRRVLAHYEEQTEAEAVAEDETAFEDRAQTIMEIPTELVPAVRDLIARHGR
jgi:hypothetical protein